MFLLKWKYVFPFLSFEVTCNGEILILGISWILAKNKVSKMQHAYLKVIAIIGYKSTKKFKYCTE